MSRIKYVDFIGEIEEAITLDEVDKHKPTIEDAMLPNTNFYFTHDDFKAASQPRRHSTWMNIWRDIDEFEEHELEWKKYVDGKIVWKVVTEVEDDEFRLMRKKENILFCTKYCPVYDIDSELSENNFAQVFWLIWLGDFNDIGPKQKQTRKTHKTSQLIWVNYNIFDMLIIGLIVFAQSGQNSWNTDKTHRKVSKKVSSNADFGKHIKFQRVKSNIAKKMKDLPWRLGWLVAFQCIQISVQQ